MIGVNLLPASILAARQRRRRLRTWLAATAAAAAAATIPLTWNTLRSSRASNLERQLVPLRAEVERVRGKLKVLAGEQVRLRAEIDRADALRRKRRWSDLLGALAAQMPAQVWLTAIESVTPVNAGAAVGVKPAAEPGADKPAAAPVRLAGPTGLRLSGYALDHEWLYAYIGALKRMGVFKSVELTQADTQTIGSGDAVTFVVQCTWTGEHG